MDLADWTVLAVVAGGEPLEIEGVDVWWHEWHRLDVGTLEVPHPSHPRQRHELWPYFVDTGGDPVLFCAGELSNGVWCFHVPANGQPARRCAGMTVNERLWETGLDAAFDAAVADGDERRARDVLIATGLTARQAAETAAAAVARARGG